MHFVIFGLTVSSSWGNGHATLWRGLLKALARRGHSITFFERDLPFYANARDDWEQPEGVRLHLYSSFEEAQREVDAELARADVAIVSSYCPDAVAATSIICGRDGLLSIFYDLDTPVTLDALRTGEDVAYMPPGGLAEFDLVLSYTGGAALEELQTRLGARRVAPLYGWVDPDVHRPAAPLDEFRCSLSYLGTYARDRQAALEELLLRAAQRLPAQEFVIGGAQYPADFPWQPNVRFVRHLDPMQHAAFFCSGRATLNITRRAMAAYGYCPSGRLFEAAACGTPVVSDQWDGLDQFFRPNLEILPVGNTQDVIDVLSLSDAELRRVGEAARARALRDHTAAARAHQLEQLIGDLASDPLPSMPVRDQAFTPSLT